jgi:hypothetical protein
MILFSNNPQVIQRSAARTTVPDPPATDPTSNHALATCFTVVTWLDFDFISMLALERNPKVSIATGWETAEQEQAQWRTERVYCDQPWSENFPHHQVPSEDPCRQSRAHSLGAIQHKKGKDCSIPAQRAP